MSSKYELIYKDIESKITSGIYYHGQQLPTEAQLCNYYNVSRITVIRALSELLQKGYIYKHQGKGSFVKGIPHGESSYQNRFITLILVNIISSLNQITSAISKIANEYGYNLVIYTTDASPEKELNMVKKAIADNTSGIIIFPISENINKEYFSELVINGFPIVFIDKSPSTVPANYVTSNNFMGMYELTDTLVKMGHRNFAFACDSEVENVKYRYRGFIRALNANGINFDVSRYIATKGKDIDTSSKRVDTILALKPRPSCIVCASDLIATNCLSVLKHKNVKVPDEISITGFDNLYIADIDQYSLTTVSQDFGGIGKIAAETLMDIINGRSLGNTQKYLPCNIVFRNSVKTLESK